MSDILVLTNVSAHDEDRADVFWLWCKFEVRIRMNIYVLIVTL